MGQQKILVLIGDWRTSFYYSNKELFNREFQVSYLQFAKLEDNPTVPSDVNVVKYKYLWSNNFNKLINHIYYYYYIAKFIKKNNYDLVCIGVLPCVQDSFLFLFKLLLPKKFKFYLGLCLPLGDSRILKAIFRLNLKLFRYIGGDTPLLRKELHLENRKLFCGDMGYSDRYVYKERDFSSMRLVYIGVLDVRRIDKTIDGLGLFLRENPEIKCSYDIIGSGKPDVLATLEERIKLNHLQDIVKFHGFLELNEIKEIFDSANIGVSFVPKIKMYEGVSVTKTVEYLLCGMPVIGTSLSFNSDLIDDESGVLCEDNPSDFARSLSLIYENLHNYSSYKIRRKYDSLLSNNVIINSFIPSIKEIINQ